MFRNIFTSNKVTVNLLCLHRKLYNSSENKCKTYQKAFPLLDDGQWDQLNDLSQLITEWNHKVNLVSRKDIINLVPNHIITAMSIYCVRIFRSNESVIDVGTGGGLPGLPLAIMCPTAQFTLVDSCAKKIHVVNDIVKLLGLTNVHALVARAETIHETYDFLVGRGVSAIPKYLQMTAHLLKPLNETIAKESITLTNGLLYIKGGDFSAELRSGNVSTFSLFPVSQLLDATSPDRDYSALKQSDKSVLYIPASQIAKVWTSSR